MKFLPLVWGGIWRKPGRAFLILAQVVIDPCAQPERVRIGQFVIEGQPGPHGTVRIE